MTSPPRAATLPAGTRIGRTALCVSDLDELVDFYRTVVGLEVLDGAAARATLGVAGTPLLELERDEGAGERPRSATGLYHNAFRVPSRRALGDALHRVREHWHLDGASDHRVSEALYLTDPAGNGVEIYRDFPREEWPRTDAGQVRMATDPLDLAGVADAAAGNPRAPAGTDVGHVHLEVTSLETFREFYVGTVGFEERASVPGASFVAAGGYHHHVGANAWHHRTGPSEGRGLAWFEVVLPEPGDLERVRERFADRGITVTERPDGIAVTDPDAIELRLRTAATAPSGG